MIAHVSTGGKVGAAAHGSPKSGPASLVARKRTSDGPHHQYRGSCRTISLLEEAAADSSG